MVKPYRSRSLIFNNNKHQYTHPASTSTGSASGSPTSPTHLIGRAFFSPSFTSTSSPPAVNTPSPDLDTDPFRSSIDSIPYSHSYSSGNNTDHGHNDAVLGNGVQSTTSLVRATATTPKITLASPSTTSFQFLDHPPQQVKDRSGLDPTAAKRIAKSILKNKAKEAELVNEQERSSSLGQLGSFIPTTGPPTFEKEARRTVSTSDLRERRKSHHPLSMRTLRRQPSLVDLHSHRTKAEFIHNDNTAIQQPQMVPLASRKSSDLAQACHPRRQEQAWKNILGRRESEAWRQLVDSKDRNSVPLVIDDMISPRTRTFPAAGDDELAAVPARPTRRPAHPFLSSFDQVPDDHPQSGLSNTYIPRRQPDERVTDYAHIPVQHSRASSPEFADPIDFSFRYASPTYTYSQLDLSFSTSSGMSRCGTLGSRLDSLPMSVAMERQVPRSGLGSYESGKLEARADALRRLSGVPTQSVQHIIDAEDDGRIRMLRRAASFKKEVKKEKIRPRASSLSAKSVRESGISSPIPLNEPLPDRRRTIERARGIYLDDLTIDLGGRYGDRSPTAASTDDSLYPASTASSRITRRSVISSKPVQLDLSASEISLLAPSSVGLGFSPIGTPVSLPESLEAEAIDLTGNYGGVNENGKQLRRTVSRRRIKLDSPPPPLPTLLNHKPPDLPDSSLDSSSTPRRSILLAQNTFYIPPIVAPPSLRSSKSLSNLRPSQPSTPTTVPQVPIQSKTAYQKRAHTRRGTGAFGICSPTDAIEPLPFNEHDGISPISLPGLERKVSSPFLHASASIRMMFSKNSIARSLSKTFDRERERESSPLQRQDESIGDQSYMTVDKEWREGLLKEAVAVSLGGKAKSNQHEKRSGNPKSRLAIPKELLEALAIVDEMGRQIKDRADVVSIPLDADTVSPSSKVRDGLAADDSISVYSQHESVHQETRPLSYSTKRRSRSSTIVPPRLDLSDLPALPPLPFEIDAARLYDSIIESDRGFTTPATDLHRRPTPYHSEPPAATLQRRPTPYYSRTARQLEVDITASQADTVSLAPSTRSFRSLALRLRHRPSKTRLAEPVSSSSPPGPPVPILDTLTSRHASKEGDKNQKILEWRSEVDENGELARLEERMVKHVERERETLRDMGRREGSPGVSGAAR